MHARPVDEENGPIGEARSKGYEHLTQQMTIVEEQLTQHQQIDAHPSLQSGTPSSNYHSIDSQTNVTTGMEIISMMMAMPRTTIPRTTIPRTIR
ncbi:hypothetical protein CRG98_045354 [Punica granatum]|uniref:Uncharacterized protein n=1 Tax=Punica granatum TaxID=22663 RepID=A0A2I0HRB4_PUNGR|nr:hypothetical protein CRG98_045354 [Punica granatum]